MQYQKKDIKEIKYINGEKIIILKMKEPPHRPKKKRKARKYFRLMRGMGRTK